MRRTLILALAVVASCTESIDTNVSALSSDPAACVTEAAGKHLTCTANDVRVAEAVAIEVAGGGPLRCVEGTTVSFTATFRIALNTTARLDPRFFFGVDADPNGDGALSGTCASNVLTSGNTPNFTDLDGDQCGDINTPDEQVTVTLTNIPCVDNDGDHQLDLPTCTSWKQPGSDTVCNTAVDTAPGSPSKCSCDAGFDVPIEVVPPSAAVTKSFIGVTSACITGRYGVTVNNTSITQALSLTALTDSTFGDLFVASNTTCAPTVIPVGGSFTCAFDGTFCGATETDTITATLDDGAGTILTEVSNTLNVGATCTASGT